jgi:glycosyltransferase involved in cell wall biosynthesis
MRICLVYDCLYPYTVGGAERWYRSLAERLGEAGHDVTYLTLRQWPRGTEPDLPGVVVRSVGPAMELYTGGRRRILPPLVFGAGVFLHLLRHGRRYDVVHTASFPYFSLLAAALVRERRGFGLFVDWFELWTREYWRNYLGGAPGLVGAAVQRLCVRTQHRAFCFSRLHERRLREEGFRGEIVRLRGLYAGPPPRSEPEPAEPLVVFAGRHIPEKEVGAVLPAFAIAREAAPELRCVVFGDGPERPAVLEQLAELSLDGAAEVPGVAPAEDVALAMREALCLLAPSRREGYGLVVVEAAAVGTPSVVAAGPDNAAAELVREGENGVVAASADPHVLAAAILAIRDAGPSLRASTLAWFSSHYDELSLSSSLERVLAAYANTDVARRA